METTKFFSLQKYNINDRTKTVQYCNITLEARVKQQKKRMGSPFISMEYFGSFFYRLPYLCYFKAIQHQIKTSLQSLAYLKDSLSMSWFDLRQI